MGDGGWGGYILLQQLFYSRKYGFNRQQRPSFEDRLGLLKGGHPNLHWFLPINNRLPFLDRNLQPVGIAPHQNMGMRLVDVVANSSRVTTSERHIIENSFARVHEMAYSGNLIPVPHQLLQASRVQPTPDLPSIAIYLDVMAVFRRNRAPYRLKYELAPGVTYIDHGRDLLYRLNKENQLCTTKGLV